MFLRFIPAACRSAFALGAVCILTSGTTRGDSASTASAPAAAPAGAAESSAPVDAGFDLLAGFKIEPPPFDPNAKPGSPGPSLDGQIPGAVRKLDGRRVVVTGFMLPIKMEGGLVTELLLMRTQMMCCYGVIPQVNEWVLVRMGKKGVHALPDVPVAFTGVLHVSALYENGFLTAIYQLDGEKMSGAKSG